MAKQQQQLQLQLPSRGNHCSKCIGSTKSRCMMRPSIMSLLWIMVAVAIKLKSYALSFSIPQTFPSTRLTNKGGPCQVNCRRSTCSLHILNMIEDDAADDGDDGWGDEVGTSSSPVDSSASSADRLSKSQELAELTKLQNDLATKQSRQVSSGSMQQSNSNTGGERDLFIPVVTLISVIGFTGLYGYEMLRLYSRGELYLPWEN